MDNNFWCLFLSLPLVVCGEEPPHLSVKFNQNGILYTQINEVIMFGCEINRDSQFLTNNTVSIIRKSALEESEHIVSQTPNHINNDSNYHVNPVPVPGDKILMNISFQVRDLDEGIFICKVQSSDVKVKDELEVQIKKPVKNIYLKFGNLRPTSNSSLDPVNVLPANYPVVCTAEGSNSAATVHLYLDGKQIQKVANKTDRMESRLKEFRTVVTGNVSLRFSNLSETIECVATAEVGSNFSVKFPFKTQVYDPDITCTDTEAYPGQRDATITCTVDYQGLNITNFKYEFAGDGSQHSGQTSAEFNEVSKEHLSSTKVRVNLKLRKVEDWYFQSKFYFVVELENGHVTKQSIKLHKIRGSPNSSTIVHSWLTTTLLVPVSTWLILYRSICSFAL